MMGPDETQRSIEQIMQSPPPGKRTIIKKKKGKRNKPHNRSSSTCKLEPLDIFNLTIVVSSKLVNSYLTRNQRLTSPVLNPGMQQKMNATQTTGMMLSDNRRFEQCSTQTYDQRKIWDGTSEREVNKALTTYLNNTGPADYNLPNLVGTLSVVSGKRNHP